MTDRELLECAARAAGLLERAIIYEEEDGTGFYAKIGKREYWRPRQDDADALRLALDLGITIEWRERMQYAVAKWARGSLNQPLEPGCDKYAAAKLAIVRAAAAIGEKMGAPLVRAD